MVREDYMALRNEFHYSLVEDTVSPSNTVTLGSRLGGTKASCRTEIIDEI